MEKQLRFVWPEWKITEKIGEGSFGLIKLVERAGNDILFCD